MVKNSLTILINLCDDSVILESLSSDPKFVDYVGNSILDVSHPHTDLFCMLLANLAKRDTIVSIFDFKRRALNAKLTAVADPASVSAAEAAGTQPVALPQEELEKIQKGRDNREAAATKIFGPPGYRDLIDCLLDCFVKGYDRKLNKFATFDYLAYFFSDLSRFTKGREHFVSPRVEQPEYSEKNTADKTGEQVYPVTKLLVFSESPSKIRREGVASTIKNCLFDVKVHKTLVFNPDINILPYILLPLTGNEEIPEDEMFELPEELQLLPDTKKRETESSILVTYIECLLLLSSTKEIRQYLRDKSVYTIIKILHANTDQEDVAEACDRLVQVLMRDDDPDIKDPENIAGGDKVDEEEEEDEDDQIVEVV